MLFFIFITWVQGKISVCSLQCPSHLGNLKHGWVFLYNTAAHLCGYPAAVPTPWAGAMPTTTNMLFPEGSLQWGCRLIMFSAVHSLSLTSSLVLPSTATRELTSFKLPLGWLRGREQLLSVQTWGTTEQTLGLHSGFRLIRCCPSNPRVSVRNS